MALNTTRERASQWLVDAALAQRLAASLRNHRLSVLQGEADSGKSTLIELALLPLLHRRAFDAAIAQTDSESRVILPFPERRSAARVRLSELVVFCNSWSADPLANVHEAIDASLQAAGAQIEDIGRGLLYPARASLPERAQALGIRYGTRLLFVFDGFEVFLTRLNQSREPDALVDSLVRLLNRRLPANVLIAIRADAQPLLEPITRRLFDEHAQVLTLPDWHAPAIAKARSVSATALQSPVLLANAAPPPAMEPSPLPETTVPAEIYADIAHTLARTKTVSTAFEWVEAPELVELVEKKAVPAAPELDGARLSALAAAAAPSTALQIAAGQPGVPLPLALTRWMGHANGARRFWLWVLACALLVAVAVATLLQERSRDPASAALTSNTTGAAPVALPPSAAPKVLATPMPRLKLLVDAHDDSVARLSDQLALAVANERGVNLDVLNESDAVKLLDARSGPHLSIVRYDALKEAAQLKSKPEVQVVAPLFTEELYFVVRAGSPLRFIHQIKGLRINVGPATGSRATTVREVYRQMFEKSLPGIADTGLEVSTALEQLATGSTRFEVVAFAASQPSAVWDRLEPSVRGSLKLLELDPQNPASRRALQEYLPARLASDAKAPLGQAPTLASMAFLVFSGKPDASQSEALREFANALCRSLPKLRQNGSFKWHEVQPGLELDTGWPVASETQASWSECATSPKGSNFSPPSPVSGNTTLPARPPNS